jgi:predicted  nucleic acid-binding Zn-ribbon protein
MGVSQGQIEEWLDTCGQVAQSATSGDDFVKTVLELSRLSSETGLNYSDLLAEYKAREVALNQLEVEIDEKKKQFVDLKAAHEKELERARKGLVTINRATEIATESLRQRKEQIRADLDEYVTRKKLTLKKIDMVISIFDRELKKSRLTHEETEYLTHRIQKAGLLTVTIKELESEKSHLQDEVSRLKGVYQYFKSECDKLVRVFSEKNKALRETEGMQNKFESRLASLREEYFELYEQFSRRKHDVYITGLVLDFMSNPKRLNHLDFDRLLGMMIAVRQVRRGEKLRSKSNAGENLECKYPVPWILGIVHMTHADIDHARKLFAMYLSLLVRDKFVTKSEHENAVCVAALKVFSQQHRLRA